MADEIKSGDDSVAEELLTIDEAAAFLDTSKSTLYRLLGQGDVKGTKVGKQWRFRKPDLRVYLERGSVATAIDSSARADLDTAVAGLGATEPFESDEDKIVYIAHSLIKEGITNGCSDIHFEPNQDELVVRCRIDGVLHHTRSFPRSVLDAVITRLKEAAGMNTMEKRVPQDGRIPTLVNGREYDIRVNCVPTYFGESIVMRVLDTSSVLIGLDNLGIGPAALAAIERAAGKPNGIMITTGPTGSGKTTLMYSCLKKISGPEIKLVTVEDPIESILPGVMQVAVNRRAGLTYAIAMRSFLRQDPDVILVGEMRDLETAQVSIEAALTGHHVMTSLHTEDAPGALLRLVDMGIERYLVAATVACVIGTRLARRLCTHCKTVADPDEAKGVLDKVRALSASGGYTIPEKPVLYDAVGCRECRDTGYRGRLGLHEVLTCNPKLVTLLLGCGTLEEMTQLAVASGMRTLLADGVSRAVTGETTIEEVLRATAPAY